MSESSDLNVTLHKIDQESLASIFPNDVDESDLLTFLKFSTEQAADEVFWMKSDSSIFYVNSAACQKLAYERDELIGMRVWEWDPLFPKEVWPTFWEELKEKKHIDFETQHQTKQGKVFPVRIKAHFLSHKGEEYLFAYVSDISDMKEQAMQLEDRSAHLEALVEQRTAELEQEKKKFEEFVNLAPVGIAINRLEDGAFEYINSEFSRFTGYTVEELNKMDYWQLTPKEYEAQEQVQLDSMAEKGQYGPYQKEYIHKAGHRYPVLLSGIKIEDLEGKEYIWSVVQDISLQKEYEDSLRKTNKDLEASKDEALRSAQVKSQFLANMSHEIRTPMNGIVGLTNLLLGSPLNDEQKDWTLGVKASTDTLLTIINDILDISKIESGKLTIESTPFALMQTIHSLVQPLFVTAKSKNIAFSVKTNGIENANYLGDPVRIKQILTNLANNAIKFTDQGSVNLLVEQKPSTLPGHAKLVFTITDTGIGIPAQTIDSLFQRFAQADSSTTRRFGGTGLGLSICKQLAELMGGDIGCESREGEGSTFWFSLDLRIDSAAGESKQAVGETREAIDLSGLKVLLVEDVKINQVVAESTFQKMGMHVDIASNGLEAVNMVSQSTYDLVFMDCHMPEMDGFEATRKIRSVAAYKNLPIIALTASALKEERDKCISSGMNAVVTKPFEPSDIVSVIRSQNIR